MIDILKKHWKEAWCLDFEFGQPPGEVVIPRCMVAREIFTGRTIRAWADDLAAMKLPPFGTDSSRVFIAYNASSEMSNFLALGWPVPERILDLCFEFKQQTNGMDLPYGKDLLSALLHFGLPSMEADEKAEMRELAIRGGSYTDEEKEALLRYCEQDVVALERLLPAMAPTINLGTALFRGRYAPALARMEREGIPLDLPRLTFLYEHWDAIFDSLIRSIDAQYGVFDGPVFRMERFVDYLCTTGIPWPTTKSGRPEMTQEVWIEKAKLYPVLEPLRQLMRIRSQLRSWNITVGSDGRSRCPFFGFSTKTGRNAPRARDFLFALPKWVRGLVRPPPGHSLILADWSAQEFGIVAALSKDERMMDAYVSGDPYVYFAKVAGALPPGATKSSHPKIRELFKTCTLATLYGQEAAGLAARIGRPEVEARELLRHHHQIFRRFWAWSETMADFFIANGYLPTVFDWRIHRGTNVSLRTIRNFPAQGNAAEMMRLAACLMTEAGLRVLCPIHDAFLVEVKTPDLASTVDTVKDAMSEASKAVLDGFDLRVDARTVTFPDSLLDDAGRSIWEKLFENYPTPDHPSPLTHKDPITSYCIPEGGGWVAGSGWPADPRAEVEDE
jgi:hypothetical protein